jgi:hypothetical protein
LETDPLIRPATRIAACLVLAWPTLTGGCSMVFVRPTTVVAPGISEAGSCTTSRVAPAIDTIIAAAQGANTIFLLASEGGGAQGEAVVGLSASLVAAFTASAVYGFSATRKCRDLKGSGVNPYQPTTIRKTRAERRSEEAAEEAAVQARIREQAAADARAAGEAAQRATPAARPAAPATTP